MTEVNTSLFYYIIKGMDTIGYFGPQILAITTFVLLFKKKMLLQFYLVGYIINILLNIVLKGLIKQSRPSEDKHMFNIWLNNGMKTDRHWYDRFGMPSGHAENVFYSTVFIYFASVNSNWLIFYLLISLNTIYQRVKYKNHTVLQVIVGSIVGSMMGWLVYYFSQVSIKGKMSLKQDDNAPI
jgi:membrane-associated phospholipid phosphatase